MRATIGVMVKGPTKVIKAPVKPVKPRNTCTAAARARLPDTLRQRRNKKTSQLR